jgi:drug/metabolite transporter (DMT)-like permease
LSLGSSLCYAILLIAEEYLLHSYSLHLFLFRFSISAFPISLCLSGAVEWKTIRDFEWCWQSVLLIVGYGIALAGYDTLAPFVVQFSDATTMNLSLLTTNFYSLGVSIWLFHLEPSWLYLLGFCCVPIAIAIFVIFGPPPKAIWAPPEPSPLMGDQAAAVTDQDGADEAALERSELHTSL